jgi:hypothetical protein
LVVEAVAFNETRPTVGEAVTVSALVTNEGERTGTTVVSLRIDDDVVATRDLRLAAGESGTVDFVWTFADPGERAVGVGPVSAGTLTVEKQSASSTTDDATATRTRTATGTVDGLAVEIVEARSVYSWVRAGFDASVRTTVRNPTDSRVNRSLTVRVDGEQVGTRTVSVGPGERRQVDVEFPAIEGAVTVEDVDAGRLRVGAVSERSSTAEPTSAATGPGFGAWALLAALCCLLPAWHRRTRR